MSYNPDEHVRTFRVTSLPPERLDSGGFGSGLLVGFMFIVIAIMASATLNTSL